MKKILLTIIAGVAFGVSASAQCIPNPMYANEEFGLWPDSAEFVTDFGAMAGVDYETVIDIKTLRDTMTTATILGQTNNFIIHFKAFRINSVSGVPNGFTYTIGGPTVSNNQWVNTFTTQSDTASYQAVQGCLQITAAAADVTAAAPSTGYTDYPLTVIVDAQVGNSNILNSTLKDKWLSDLNSFSSDIDAIPITDYVIRVHAANGVTEMLNLNKFDVAQSYPNPAVDFATISFTTPTPSNVEVRVYNMLGAMVHKTDLLTEKGVNNYKMRTGQLSSGLYIYTVSNGVETITKKMNVK